MMSPMIGAGRRGVTGGLRVKCVGIGAGAGDGVVGVTGPGVDAALSVIGVKG